MRRGWQQAFETEVVADTAACIWNLASDYFYDNLYGNERIAQVSGVDYVYFLGMPWASCANWWMGVES